MIFRSPAKDMLTLSFYGGRAGKLGTSVRFQNAAEIAERDRKIKEQAPALRAAAKAKEEEEAARLAAAQVVPKVPVTLPTDATEVKQTKDSIKFTLPKGKGKAAVENLRAQFRDAGWKEDVASVTGMSGALHLSKEGQSLTITYSDTGFLPRRSASPPCAPNWNGASDAHGGFCFLKAHTHTGPAGSIQR